MVGDPEEIKMTQEAVWHIVKKAPSGVGIARNPHPPHRQILPNDGVIDHVCHAWNAIGQRSLDPIVRVAWVHLSRAAKHTSNFCRAET